MSLMVGSLWTYNDVEQTAPPSCRRQYKVVAIAASDKSAKKEEVSDNLKEC
jgi:hypothetical protein